MNTDLAFLLPYIGAFLLCVGCTYVLWFAYKISHWRGHGFTWGEAVCRAIRRMR